MRGDWATGSSYKVGDVVAHEGGSLACLVPHVAAADIQVDPDALKWQVIAAPSGGSGGAGGLVYQQLQDPAVGSTFSRHMCGLIVTEPCYLVAATPIIGTLMAPSAPARPTPSST